MTISMKRLLSGAAALALVTIPMSAQAAEKAALLSYLTVSYPNL